MSKKRPYPTQKNGLAVSPYELGFTEPTPEHIDGRRTDEHHLYFYARMYEDVTFRYVFRNLVSNVFRLYKEEHNAGGSALHSVYGPPRAPKDSVMLDVIDETIEREGQLTLFHKSGRHPRRIILPDAYERLKYTSRV